MRRERRDNTWSISAVPPAFSSEHLYTRLSVSAHVHGYTVTLQQTYLDSTVFVFWYIVQTPTGQMDAQSADLGIPQLTVQQQTLKTQLADSWYNQRTSARIVEDYLDYSSAGAGDLTVPCCRLTGQARALPIHLTASYLLPNSVSGSTSVPIDFAFSLPFYPGRTANIQQTASDQGKSLTLEQLFVEPAATRIYLQESPRIPNDEGTFSGGCQVSIVLSIGNWRYPPSECLYQFINGSELLLLQNGQIFDQHGDWHLQISYGVPVGSGEFTNYTWTYSFLFP